MITNSAKVDIWLSVKILLIYLNVFSVKKMQPDMFVFRSYTAILSG